MTFNDSPQQTDIFFKMVVVSLAFHLMLMLMGIVKVLLFPAPPLDWTQNAVRVDLVALPEKNQQMPEVPAEPEKPSKPKEIEKPSPPSKKVVLDKIKKQVQEEERQNRLKQIAQEVAEQERKLRQKKVQEALAGNAISKGNSLSGLAKFELDEYTSQLHAHIHKNWSLPEWLSNDTLVTVVVVQVDFRGVVLNRFVEKSSGDPRFDEYALKAVDDSSPLPPPPNKLAGRMKDEGVVLRLTPKGD